VDFNSAAFGSISETPDVTAGNRRLGEGGPRVIQFGLKLIFLSRAIALDSWWDICRTLEK